MFRTRRLGVQEGNAIEDIVAYETKLERGTATAEDKLAYDAACRVFGRRGSITSATKSTPHTGVESEEGSMPPFNHTVNPVRLGGYGDVLVVVGAMFVLCALSFLLVLVLVWVANGLVSLAYP